ncbi:AraC family ligand binding domain-containing protein [Pedobacter zeae]|uniref:AraC family transcriptional regulator n=1 Tax=Pedobacter zeae TaxID=1737356 RepID=A0A7W6KDP3_9SPHI|nr:AraC family transcriptional regulator [Pedobacter zeae]MBB4108860.1 AraC-like DNA-binding protein [Pedobacter zeae]GGH08796.1 AraC family transcriptional regulator [Pedobacter zeae]
MIKRYVQFQPIVISAFEISKWHHPVHRHNHYELIYIKSGSGQHIVNEIPIDYEGGHLFLIGPEDEHHFKIDKRTHFIYIKFTGIYIHQKENNSAGLQHLEYLIKSRETHFPGFNFTADDQLIVEHIIALILSLNNNILQNEALIWSQILMLSIIMQRNMPEIKVSTNRSKDIQAIFCYLHKNIYQPKNLKASIMASHFRLSADYIGPYFKRNTGITLRQYIHDYRNHLIRQRIASGRFGLKQVAAEFGLVDESHVSKLMRIG